MNLRFENPLKVNIEFIKVCKITNSQNQQKSARFKFIFKGGIFLRQKKALSRYHIDYEVQ